MPLQLTCSKRKLTSSRVIDYSGAIDFKRPKVLKLSQVQEQEKQLDDRRRKAEHRKFFIFITSCERTCIYFVPTGLTTQLRQKIAESGMIANKSPSAIDWTIIPNNPDTPTLDEYMNIDSELDEWEDVVEDDIVTDMQDEMDKTAARHATLQTTILYVILIPYFFFSLLKFTAVHLVAAERAACWAHGFYDAGLPRRNGPPLCHPLSTRILNGNPPALRLALRLNLTSSG